MAMTTRAARLPISAPTAAAPSVRWRASVMLPVSAREYAQMRRTAAKQRMSLGNWLTKLALDEVRRSSTL